MNATQTLEQTKAKDFLERDGQPLIVGDVVTIDDYEETVEALIVKRINDDLVTVCGIELTAEKDDIELKEFVIHSNSLIKVGLPFINIGGLLYRIREDIINKRPINLIKFPY